MSQVLLFFEQGGTKKSQLIFRLRIKRRIRQFNQTVRDEGKNIK